MPWHCCSCLSAWDTLFCTDFVTASCHRLRLDQCLCVTLLGSHLPDVSPTSECRQGRSVQL